MTTKRPVWLTPRELRRDFGPVEDLHRQPDGAAGQLRYDKPAHWRKTAMLWIFASGAGLAIATPVVVAGGQIAMVAAIVAGAFYAAALRLTLIVRARDRTLYHHGRFLPRLSELQLSAIHRRPVIAAMRLANALAGRQQRRTSGDLCVAIVLRGLLPLALGLLLASGAWALAAIWAAATLVAGLAVGWIAEGRRQLAGFHAKVAKSGFAHRAAWSITVTPTLRDLGVAHIAAARLHRRTPIAAERRMLRTTLRMSGVFRLAIPALPIPILLLTGVVSPEALFGIMLATVTAGQSGVALGVQAMRLVQARRRSNCADRLFTRRQAASQVARIETVEVRDLAFRYPGSAAAIFEGVDLALRRGEVLALASPSGSGKTTLLRVLTGIAEPAGGQVLINGRDAREVGYRHRVAAVFQDEPVGAGTIRAAITGGSALDLDEVWAVARRVGMAEMIDALPMGMQTLIVEGPFPPSLLQPLLIARALAQDPDLLILDEALGALPLVVARQLLDSLRAEGKIVILASHDPALVSLVDKVLTPGVA